MAVPRPVIGIACAVLPAQWGPWHQPAAVVAADYIHQVQAAGGIAVVIPPQPGDPGDVLDRIDALMLTGGNDLQAYLYGDEPHAEAEAPDPGRDAWEFGLVRQAIARDMPFLGICRGMQVMNVAFGGTLTQHLPESLGTTDHRRTTGSFDGNDHLVDLQDGSLAARVAGEVASVGETQLHRLEALLPPLGFRVRGETMFEEMEFPAGAHNPTKFGQCLFHARDGAQGEGAEGAIA